MLKGLAELSKVIEESYTNIEKPIYIGTIFHNAKKDEVIFTFGEVLRLIINSPKWHVGMNASFIEIWLKKLPLKYCAQKIGDLRKPEEEQSELLIEADHDRYKKQADLLKGTNARLTTPDGYSSEFKKHWLDEPYENLSGPWDEETIVHTNRLYIGFEKTESNLRIVASKEEFTKWVKDITTVKTEKLERLIEEVKKY